LGNPSDLLSVGSWWLVVQALGLIVWPLAYRVFRWLPDRGYMLAKPLGLLLVSYILWLLASIGILQNNLVGIGLVVVIVSGGSQWVYRRNRDRSPQSSPSDIPLTNWLREHLLLVVAYELVFGLAFIGWAIFRAHNPDVLSGEKSMELAFLNAVSRSAKFPPYDPWLSGGTLPYYYFGYLMISLLNRVSGVSTGTSFSLSNALWFALSAAGAFGVVANLILLTARRARRAAIAFGLLGSVLLMLLGNFEAPLEVAHAVGWGTPEFWTRLDILDLNEPVIPPAEERSVWPPIHRSDPRWWWRASRVIHDYPPTSISPQLAAVLDVPPDPNTDFQELIDEFPLFSFVFGDMHPHVLNMPFVLLAIVLALNIYQATATDKTLSLWKGEHHLPLLLVYPLVIGGLSFLNSWDFPVYLLLLVAAYSLGRFRAGSLRLRIALRDALALGVLSVMLYLPYYANFRSPVSGVWPNLFNGTRVSQFFIALGPLIIIGLLFGFKIFTQAIRSGYRRRIFFALQSLAGGVAIIVAASGTAFILGMITYNSSPTVQRWFDDLVFQMNSHGISLGEHLLARLSDPWLPLSLASGLVAIFLLWRIRRSNIADSQSAGVPPADFVLLLFFLGLLMTLSVEFAFILDLEKTRTNVVFKLYYQVWIVWSIASAYGVYYLLGSPARLTHRASRAGTIIIMAITLGLSLIYPALTITEQTSALVPTAPTLDAMWATAKASPYPSLPDIYAAVEWLNAHVPGSSIILEASTGQLGLTPGRPRISSWTGLPTVLGQPQHEIQWRGNDDVLRQRLSDVETIYSTLDPDMALALLQRYQVSFVLVGERERRQFSVEGLSKFDRMFPIVFEQGDVKIYRVQ
jgi:YYY domain-containing protein